MLKDASLIYRACVWGFLSVIVVFDSVFVSVFVCVCVCVWIYAHEVVCVSQCVYDLVFVPDWYNVVVVSSSVIGNDLGT